MLLKAFSSASPLKRVGFFLACCWTLIIIGLCFLPSSEIPKVNIPFIDKWVHFVLFGVFTLLWLFAFPKQQFGHLLLITTLGIAFGWLVELVQGQLPELGRAMDSMDILADGIGSAMGTLLFAAFASLARKKYGT